MINTDKPNKISIWRFRLQTWHALCNPPKIDWALQCRIYYSKTVNKSTSSAIYYTFFND